MLLLVKLRFTNIWKVLTSAHGALVKETNIVKISWNLCSQILESVKNVFVKLLKLVLNTLLFGCTLLFLNAFLLYLMHKCFLIVFGINLLPLCSIFS